MDASRVVAVAVLCFVRDTDQAMSEIARVLKSGGRVVIGELGAQSLSFAIYRRRSNLSVLRTVKSLHFQ
jgi:ubiquinone/menaquinone biosynthesis C-methylase UbiE